VAAIEATRASGRGVVAVLPDARDAMALAAAIEANLPGEAVAVLIARAGPEARYRQFLRAWTGEARIVVGTRAAAFAPVADLGLAAIWDDGASTHRDPRAPYPHAREILALRAGQVGAGLLIGSLGRTAAAQALVGAGWLKEIAAPRELRRRTSATVTVPNDADLAEHGNPGARIPTLAHRMLARGLERGPVLVQVARAGYLPSLACAQCRGPARCAACHGPLGYTAQRHITCGWCGRPETAFTCGRCGGRRVRSRVVGSARTAEELGLAFPGAAIVQSSADGPRGVVDRVGADPALVVATPGAEPVAEGGYTAAALLDAWAAGGPGGLDSGVESLTRWLSAVALVRPAARGGEAILVGNPEPVAAQALVRWDPAGHADRDLAERAALRFPPTMRMASITGPRRAVAAFLDGLTLPDEVEVLGPMGVAGEGRGGAGAGGGVLGGAGAGDGVAGRADVGGDVRGHGGSGDEALSPADAGDQVQALLRTTLGASAPMLAALRAARATHSLRRDPPVKVQVDPPL
jgi:primosomal protein N' (replication factor Y)